jgi:capsular polysaccharide biosynthesis protein
MKERAAEILYKHKLLILLPVLIILPLSLALALQPRSDRWQAFAVVWVEQPRPLYQDDRLGYTPGPNTAQLLNDLVHTRTFALDVARQTRLATKMDSPEGEDWAMRRIWRAVRAFPTSNAFVTITVTTDDPDLTYEVAQSVLINFQTQLRARLEAQNRLALDYYAGALRQAEQNLTKSRADLAAYLAAHPELTRPGVDPGPFLTARDTTLARLTEQANHDQEIYSSLLRRYEEIQASARAGLEGQQLAFTVVDEPQPPLRPVPRGRLALIKLPAIGLVLASLLSGVIGLVLVLTNRTVLDARDIQRGVGLPVLEEIPELRRRRFPWQRAPRHAVRLRIVAPARPSTA